MAGGAEWTLDGKKDAYYSYTTGTSSQGTLQHWRRKEVLFQISRQVQESYVDAGEGALGQVTGLLTFRIGAGRVTSRSAAARKFVCEGDGYVIEGEAYSGYYRQQQEWRWIGEDEEYDPETGLAVT
jgi:hypothetical protein